MKSYELELKRLKRLKKIDQYSLDIVFACFYFAGQFGNNIPVDFGREVTKTLIEKLGTHKRT